MIFEVKKRGQIAVFVVIALVILAGIISYFLIRGTGGNGVENVELNQVFEYYSKCIDEQVKTASGIAGNQGGYIYSPVYEAESEYSPFSNQLNFLGIPVPYWYYISGNGLIKENVPKKGNIEDQIEKFVEENLNKCDFESFREQGFAVNVGNPDIKVNIQDSRIVSTVSNSITVAKSGNSVRKTEFKVETATKLGQFYSEAMKIYDKQKKEAFLENYSADVLRLYAPVDGVEITCGQKVWKTREVVQNLKDGLEANVQAIKLKGDYYTLSDKKNKYFVVDLPVKQNVRFLYSKNWPSKFEINGDGVDQELMIADPFGTQQGLNTMGFCYVPYHYVYDIKYPVLVQLYNENEVFQFPVVVVVDKNLPREGIYSLIDEPVAEDFCKHYNSDLNIRIADSQLRSVDANISYLCFDQECKLGASEDGEFNGKAPTCVNGYLRFNAEGYGEKKELFSTNSQNSFETILDREYGVNVSLKMNGVNVSQGAIISFVGPVTASAVFPDVQGVKLVEGLYNISVYVYGNTSITIPETTKRECREMSNPGFLGIFGGTREKCYDIKIPETKIDSGLIGGGKAQEYILPSQLAKGKIVLNVDSLPVPESLEQLQYNFQSFEQMGAFIE